MDNTFIFSLNGEELSFLEIKGSSFYLNETGILLIGKNESREWHLDKCDTVKSLSCVRLCVTPWTAARQSPLSMEFSRQEY